MTALAEKLKEAGADTTGAKFTAICTDALRRHPDNLGAAWADVGASFGLGFLRGLQSDMRAHEPAAVPKFKAAYGGSARNSMGAISKVNPIWLQPEEPKPYQPRVIPQARIERRQQLQEVVRSKFKNSANVAWSDVGWHELSAMSRDGVEARALLNAGPAAVPNDGRKVGDVLGVKKIDEIVGNIRAGVGA